MHAASTTMDYWPLMLILAFQVVSIVLYFVYLIIYEDSLFGRLLNLFLISIPGLGVLFYFVATSSCRRRGASPRQTPASSNSNPEDW